MKCCGAGGSAESASPNSRCTSASLMTVTGAGGWFGKHRRRLARRGELHGSRRIRDRRAADRAIAWIREQHDQVLAGTRVAVRTRCGPQPDTSAATSTVIETAKGRAVVHSGTTRSASVVPRTPTIAAGVSRRMESGESLAIRPETYAMTPRTTLSTNPMRPSAGAYDEPIHRTSLPGPSEIARVVLQRDAETAVGAGPEAVGFEDHLTGLRRHHARRPAR